MKIINKLENVATLATTSLAYVALISTPVLALTFQFCGPFTDGSGEVLPSRITVDENGDFDGFASIGTDVFGDIRMYSEADFVEQITGVTNPDTGIPSIKYTFSFDNNGVADPDNNFMAYLPEDIFPTSPGERPDIDLEPFGFIIMEETRDGVLRKDEDKLQVVPEPTSLLGTFIAIGLGGILTGKNLKKLKQ